MKISLFTVMLPDMTPEEAAPALAEAGYKGVEWRVTRTPEAYQAEAPSFWRYNRCSFEPTQADAIRAHELAQSYDLTLPSLGTYIQMGDLEAVGEAMQFAQNAGAACVRVGVGKTGNAPFQRLFEDTRAFLSDVQALSKTYDIKALVETHHQTICASASAAIRLVDHTQPEHVGVLYDPGNMVYEGYEDYRNGVTILGDYLAHVHLKNAVYAQIGGDPIWRARWSQLDNGIVDFPKLFEALAEVNYDGWLGIEDFSQTYSSQEAIVQNIKFIQQWEL